MKKILSAVVAAIVMVPAVHAQSSSNANQSANSTSNASNAGANSSTNNSTSNANQTSTSAATSYNAQSNGSSSSSGGGNAGATGGSAGSNVTATISPTTTIQFNSPPTSRVESASVQDMNSRIEQSVSGTTEQILSGTRTERIEYSGTTTVRNVPSMNAPPLTSSNDTCMGSFSAGIALAGFGASGGNTYTDEHCKRIKMSRELWNKGMKAASLALDCMDKDARDALELTGFVCPQTTRARQRAGLLPSTVVAGAAVAPTLVTAAAETMGTNALVVTPVVARVSENASMATSASEGTALSDRSRQTPAALAAIEDSVTVRVMGRPGYEHVNPDDPFINR